MSDSIQSIRIVPQINKLNPKRRTGDKKGNKENKKDFTKHMSSNDEDMEGKGHNQVKKDYEKTEHKKQKDDNTLQDKIEDDFGDGCGSFLDTEI